MSINRAVTRLSLSRKIGVIPSGATPTATTLEIVSGNNQSATVGQALPSPLVVRVRDQFGNPFLGRSLTSAVNSGGGGITPGNVTTDANGLASFTATVGGTAGANSFTVTSAGLSGSPAVFTGTAVAASGGALNPDMTTNLPAGLTPLIEHFANTITPAPWFIVNRGGTTGGPPRIVTDPTSPTGSTNVIEQFYAGTQDGQEPQYLFGAFPRPCNHFFCSVIFKLDPNYNVAGHKWLLITGNVGGGWMGLIRPGFSPPGDPFSDTTRGQVRWQSQGSGTTPGGSDQIVNPVTPLLARPIIRGQWYKVQWEMRISPARIRTWLNDELIEDTALATGWQWNGQTQFTAMEMGSTWGGGNGYTAPANNIIRYAQVRVWGNP